MMTLYYSPGTSSLVIRIALQEISASACFVRVDTQTHLTGDGADFHTINPLGYVPVLLLNDGITLLREVSAILLYLGDMGPETGVIPRHGQPERYRMYELLNFLSSELHKGFVQVYYATPGEASLARIRARLTAQCKWLDARLAGSAFLMGDYSLADAYLFTLVQWTDTAWLPVRGSTALSLDGLTHLQAWYDRVAARPAVQRALMADADGVL